MRHSYNGWLGALNQRGVYWDDADFARQPSNARYRKGDYVRVTASAGQVIAPPLPPAPPASDEPAAPDPLGSYLLGAFGGPWGRPEPKTEPEPPALADYANLVGRVEAVGWYWGREAIGATADAPVCVHVYRVLTLPDLTPGNGTLGGEEFWAEEWALSPA